MPPKVFHLEVLTILLSVWIPPPHSIIFEYCLINLHLHGKVGLATSFPNIYFFKTASIDVNPTHATITSAYGA